MVQQHWPGGMQCSHITQLQNHWWAKTFGSIGPSPAPAGTLRAEGPARCPGSVWRALRRRLHSLFGSSAIHILNEAAPAASYWPPRMFKYPRQSAAGNNLGPMSWSLHLLGQVTISHTAMGRWPGSCSANHLSGHSPTKCFLLSVCSERQDRKPDAGICNSTAMPLAWQEKPKGTEKEIATKPSLI